MFKIDIEIEPFEIKTLNKTVQVKMKLHPGVTSTMKINRFKTIVDELNEIYGELYTYDYAEYNGQKEKIKVYCNMHGTYFFATPGRLLEGREKCKECTNENKIGLAKELFINNSASVHGDTYTYDNVVYINAHEKVAITCKEHGDFMQSPNMHTSGKGCKKCNGKLVSDTESFISESRKVHGNRYIYDRVKYVRSQYKVDIFCRNHGYFKQKANHHLSGHGCQICSEVKNIENSLSRIDSLFSIYYIKIDNVYKIGITSRDLKVRMTNEKKYEEIYMSQKINLYDAIKIEKRIVNKFSNFKSNKTVMSDNGGNSELFKLNILKDPKKTIERMIANALIHGINHITRDKHTANKSQKTIY